MTGVTLTKIDSFGRKKVYEYVKDPESLPESEQQELHRVGESNVFIRDITPKPEGLFARIVRRGKEFLS